MNNIEEYEIPSVSLENISQYLSIPKEKLAQIPPEKFWEIALAYREQNIRFLDIKEKGKSKRRDQNIAIISIFATPIISAITATIVALIFLSHSTASSVSLVPASTNVQVVVGGDTGTPNGNNTANETSSDYLIYTIEELVSEFRGKNVLAASENLRDKKIQITGLVNSVGSYGGYNYLSIERDSSGIYCGDIECSGFDKDILAKLAIDSEITVVGVLDRATQYGNVYLKDCFIIN